MPYDEKSKQRIMKYLEKLKEIVTFSYDPPFASFFLTCLRVAMWKTRPTARSAWRR